MERDTDPKPTILDFILKIVLIDIGIVFIALFTTIFMGGRFFGISLFIFGVLFMYIGSVNRKRKFISEEINFYDPLEPHQDVLGTRPVSTYERNLKWRFKNSEPVNKFGRERAFMFSGLIAFIFSLPLICNLMFF